MTFADQLGNFRAGFFVEHRGSIARPALYDLLGTLAQGVLVVRPDDPSIPLHPVWRGIVLSWADAVRRFGCLEVEGWVVGSASPEQRDAFIEAVRRRPPLGLVGIERDGSNYGLQLSDWLVPGAVISEGQVGRRFDPKIGVDVLGFRDEFDELWSFPPWEPEDEDHADHVKNGLLRHLAMSVSRRFAVVRGNDRHRDLVAHASELLGLGAVTAAGAVAGAAFERLIKRAVVGELRNRIDSGEFVKLHHAIEAVAPPSGAGRLLAFKDLRNDIAHRLGDHPDPAQTRSDDDLYDGIAALIAFLARQNGDRDPVVLVDADPRPVLSPEAVHANALEAAETAASQAQPRTMIVGTERISEAGLLGCCEVVVRNRRLAFTRWLADSGKGASEEGADTVRLLSPHWHLERALAWCWGYTDYLLGHDVPCGYCRASTEPS